jgi:hypothetical protein
LDALGRSSEAQAQLADALAINPHFSPLHAPRARAVLDQLRSAG